jgi:Na+:H+ antiporter, NhaA family
MTERVLSHRAIAHAATNHRRSNASVVRFVKDRFLLLPLGAAIAVAWANIAGESYYRFAHAIAFPVNEIGMALFLALIAQEVMEALMPRGALHTWRRWSLSLIAAAGGFLGAALVYLGYIYLRHEEVLARGWLIAVSIDIAAGYYVLKVIFRRSNALPFLLLVAIVTDAVALIALATWTPFTESHLVGAALLLVAVATAALLRRSGVRKFWPYLVGCGAVSWWAFYLADVHPALALVPIVPFLPRQPRRLDLFAEPPDDDRVHHVEHEWNEAVQGVLFLFGLVNAGVILTGYDSGTWAVLVASMVGRPLGIVVAVALAVAAGLHLPRRFGWRELIVVALATSSGFTLSLFLATGVLPVGAVLQQIKLGALLTAGGALVAVAVARLIRVGRFAGPEVSGAHART